MKNFIYFFYYIKTTDYKLLKENLKRISKETKKPLIKIICQMVRISLKFGASFNDFWIYKFYKMKDEEKTDLDKLASSNYKTTMGFRQHHHLPQIVFILTIIYPI